MNSDFIIQKLPNLHPELDRWEYRDFWKQETTNCIQGKWANGIWMPGPLYEYINYQIIPLEDIEGGGSQTYGKPYLRDVDWEIFLLYEEARGFSGFANDDKYTCNRLFGPDKDRLEQVKDIFINYGFITEEDFKKEYIDARTYLQRVHSKDLGDPLYNNSAKNILLGGGRGLGKSLIASALAKNNFTWGGATNAKKYFENIKQGTYNTSLTVLSAWEKKWVSQMQNYVLTALKKVPGAYKDAITDYSKPAPFFVNYSGSREIGDDLGIVSPYGSRIISRIFADNPLSTNSGRPNLAVIDEIFFAKTLKEILGALKGSEASMLRNKLVVFGIGTGGQVKGSALTYAEDMFYHPEDYNFLYMEDKWEGRGKIGYFIPITKTKLTYKDPNNNFKTNEEFALKDQLGERKKLEKNRKALESYIINHPLYPSEIFLSSDNSFFPAAEIKNQIIELEKGSKRDKLDGSFKGWLKFDEKGELFFEVDQNAKPIREYPFKGDDIDKKGCTEIWKKPYKDEYGTVPRNRYIAGIDVVDKAWSTTNSLPSIFVYDRLQQEIVAEYTGRTKQPSFFYEQCRRLAEYYNATLMYEQNLVGLFTYFEQNKCLWRLADTPKSLRNIDTFVEGANTSKGITKAGTRIEENGVNYILDWLDMKIADNSDENKITTINSIALLQEMLKYQPPSSGEKINVDRISALIMLFTYDNTLQISRNKENESNKVKTFANSKYFQDRGFLKKS